MKRIIASILLIFMMGISYAQEVQNVEMADGLRSSGKIYVVVSVIAVIFLGIVSYLFYMDHRISKLEKEQK